jgi:hypothetical protein
LRNHIAALSSIVVISVVSYLPAVDNFFISDDFGLFTVIEAAEKSPRWFFESTTEFFRLMSYFYFGACYWLFGLNSEPFYWAGIALHGVVSVLVYFLVWQWTRSSPSAWAAGVFFAAYERHQEAIMWISAANETILALNCVVFLLLWRRATDSKSAPYFISAHVVFAAALFSKEAAVVLVPLAVLQLLLAGYSIRDVLRKSMILILMLGLFGALWLVVAQRNFFVTEGHYVLGWQFISVYMRSLLRLLVQAMPLMAAWMIIRFYQARRGFSPEHVGTASSIVSWRSAAICFAALLVLAILPYSFLTYLNHIPSRNTYLPSIGLAGLIGVVFASLYGRLRTDRTRLLCIASLFAVVTANVTYIWLKKEPQYRERAAPTRELIETLNSHEFRVPIHVCQFPLDPWTFSEAVTRFTPFHAGEVILAATCQGEGASVLRWEQRTAKYVADAGQFSEVGRVTSVVETKPSQ